jgi:hypothetical protein
MPHPSVESSNTVLGSVVPVTGCIDRTASDSGHIDPLPVPRPREDDVASPVCAACWAY